MDPAVYKDPQQFRRVGQSSNASPLKHGCVLVCPASELPQSTSGAGLTDMRSRLLLHSAVGHAGKCWLNTLGYLP